MKLYHYVHCPFCVRVRMGFGFLSKPYVSVVLPYNDEQTPLKLTGKKMLPIMVNDEGKAQNESLDILKEADKDNLLKWELLTSHKEVIDPLLDKMGSPVHSLCMPYWIWTPEFDETSREYFQTKKEVKRGPFRDLVNNQKVFIEALAPIFASLKAELKPFYKSSELSILDIMIAAHLWGLYVVPEFQFDDHLHEYLQKVKALTHFNYHQDFWQKS